MTIIRINMFITVHLLKTSIEIRSAQYAALLSMFFVAKFSGIHSLLSTQYSSYKLLSMIEELGVIQW